MQEIWYKAVSPDTWPNWAVVIAALGATWVALRTLQTLERQTEATRIAAEAALLNAQALVTAERPWLVGHFIQNRSVQFTENIPMKFLCEIKNLGKTPAILIDAAARAVFNTDSVALPDMPDYGHADPLKQRMLVPGATYFFWAWADGYEWKDGIWFPLEKTGSGKMPDLLVGFGCIRYRDMFGKTEEHFTRFCDCAETGWKADRMMYPNSPTPPARAVRVNGPFSPWDSAPSNYTECT